MSSDTGSSLEMRLLHLTGPSSISHAESQAASAAGVPEERITAALNSRQVGEL